MGPQMSLQTTTKYLVLEAYNWGTTGYWDAEFNHGIIRYKAFNSVQEARAELVSWLKAQGCELGHNTERQEDGWFLIRSNWPALYLGRKDFDGYVIGDTSLFIVEAYVAVTNPDNDQTERYTTYKFDHYEFTVNDSGKSVA